MILHIVVQVLLRNVSDCEELAELVLKIDLLVLNLDEFGRLLVCDATCLVHEDLVYALLGWFVLVLVLHEDVKK